MGRMARWPCLVSSLPSLFEGASTGQFLAGDDGVIHNNGRIALDDFRGYTPYFTSLDVQVVDDRLVFSNTAGRCDVVYNSSWVSFNLSGSFSTSLTQDGSVYRIGIDAVTGPAFSIEKHDAAALAMWIFGGWVVDALLEGIKSHMNSFLWSFKNHEVKFNVLPVSFSTGSAYTACGLAENFWMRD